VLQHLAQRQFDAAYFGQQHLSPPPAALSSNARIKHVRLAHLGQKHFSPFHFGVSLTGVDQGNALQHPRLAHLGQGHFDAFHFGVALSGVDPVDPVDPIQSPDAGAGSGSWRKIVPVAEIIERLESEEKERKQQLASLFKQADNRRKAAETTNPAVFLPQLVEQAQRLRSLQQLSGRNKARLRKLQAQIDLLEQEQDAEETALFLLLLALWPELLAELEITQSDEDAVLLLTMFV